jgi:hypothetical protein
VLRTCRYHYTRKHEHPFQKTKIQIFFETFKVPAFYVALQAVFVFFSCSDDLCFIKKKCVYAHECLRAGACACVAGERERVSDVCCGRSFEVSLVL